MKRLAAAAVTLAALVTAAEASGPPTLDRHAPRSRASFDPRVGYFSPGFQGRGAAARRFQGPNPQPPPRAWECGPTMCVLMHHGQPVYRQQNLGNTPHPQFFPRSLPWPYRR